MIISHFTRAAFVPIQVTTKLPVYRISNQRQCQHCPQIFENDRSFRAHFSNAHLKSLIDKSEVICYVCYKSFGSNTLLENHKKEHHLKITFPCEICSREFVSFPLLNQHINVDHAGPHVCECCDVKFPTAIGLKHHIIQKYTEITVLQDVLVVDDNSHRERLQCHLCNKQCSTQTEIETHMRTHDPKEKILDHEIVECKICNEKCNKLDIERHMKTHESDHTFAEPSKERVEEKVEENVEKRVTCDTCGKEMWHSNLNTHLRRHAGDNQAMCETCGKTFFKKADLEVHIRVHTKEKPYTCNICNKNFSQNHVLRRHMRLHTGERFTCGRCSRGFVTSTLLKFHKCWYHCKYCNKRFEQSLDQLSHEEICTGIDDSKKRQPRKKTQRAATKRKLSPDYANCTICNKVMTTTSLKVHMKVHNRTKYPCTFCGKEYSYRYLLRGHVLEHHSENPTNFLCHICGINLPSKTKLNVHNRRKHSGNIRKSTVCEICGKLFTRHLHYIQHRTVHTKEKPYACTVCEKRFSQSGTLTIHMRYHTGERPFKCERCSKGFVTKTLLKYHKCRIADL